MSEFVEVKTAELIGPALDWATAKCSWMPFFAMGEDWPGNYNVTALAGEAPILILDLVNRMWREHQGVTVPWSPSTNWAQGGPLIEQFGLDLWKHEGKFYAFHTRQHNKYCADTVLVAACRAIVAAKLGNVVQVPAELAGLIA